MSILVVGTVALDSVETPFGKKNEILGGSATYFSIAASFFNKVDIVAVVGHDFPAKYINLFRRRNIGVDAIESAAGKTFRWKGRYEYDLNTAHTLSTHLNVLNGFNPKIPYHLRDSEYVFLANIDPELQERVLNQVTRPKFVACDSMNYWITNKKRELKALLGKVDMFLLNDAEARQLTGESNLITAAQAIISLGPKAAIIKRGEYGVMYFSRNSHFVAPAYLLEGVYDPTGAGDTFAGGMMGFLAKSKRIDERNIRKSIIYGSIMASFVVEDFSVNKLLKISISDVDARFRHFRRITKF